MNDNKKILFPAGIFLILFIIELLFGTIALVGYSYISLKKNIREIEEYTLNYSKTMAEAFARMAELSLKTNKFESLKTLFHEKIQQNTIDEAIFVMADGRLIVHSNTFIEKGLRGNIANDEMAYNLELILEPVVKKSHELFFNNYNIIDSRIPFSRKQKELIEKYIYPDISTSGWLFVRGVFVDNMPAGSVCFIVSKNRIYSEIHESASQAVRIWYIIAIASLTLSFIVSLIVFTRYRSIQKRALSGAQRKAHTSAGKTVSRPDETGTESVSPAKIEEKGAGEMRIMADDRFEQFIEEPSGGRIVEKDYEIPLTLDSIDDHKDIAYAAKQGTDTGEEGYITVELLGEINDESLFPETIRSASGEYIARAIPAETLKNIPSPEIRDAIPAGRKR